MLGNNQYINFWTKKETDFLKKNYEKISTKELTKILNKDKFSVQNKLKRLGLKRRQIKLWTKKEIKFLKQNYKKIPYQQIAKHLNRTIRSIKWKTHKLRLIINKMWKQEEIDFLRKNCKIMLYKDIAKILGRTKYSVNHKTQHLKLNSSRVGYKKGDKRLTDEFLRKRLLACELKPNKPEKLLIRLFKQLNLPYKYVGNGEIFISGFNPDFINCNGQKKIIEFFGDYWHNPPKTKEKDKKRLKTYSKYGYKTLIIWEHELKNLNNVIDKIKKFDKL